MRTRATKYPEYDVKLLTLRDHLLDSSERRAILFIMTEPGSVQVNCQFYKKVGKYAYQLFHPLNFTDMKNLESLFVEFNCTTIESLLTSISNRIDWYTEMLYDDPWNTWAQVQKDSLSDLYNKVYVLYAQNGADNDIDLNR